jgi:hypothetical protein
MDRWLIFVQGSAPFLFEGTEEEAEFARCQKTWWARSPATKVRVPELNYSQRQALECLNGAKGYLDSDLIRDLINLGLVATSNEIPYLSGLRLKIRPSELGWWIIRNTRQE